MSKHFIFAAAVTAILGVACGGPGGSDAGSGGGTAASTGGGSASGGGSSSTGGGTASGGGSGATGGGSASTGGGSASTGGGAATGGGTSATGGGSTTGGGSASTGGGTAVVTVDAGPSLWDGGAIADGGALTWDENPVQFDRYNNGLRISYVCPPRGASTIEEIWGTDLYTDDSPVCPTGVHAGAITFDGGLVTVEIRPGELEYFGSTRNAVSSSDFSDWQGSYVIVR